MSSHILNVHPAQPQTTSAQEQQYQLYLLMKDDPQLQQEDIAIWLSFKMKFERLQVPQTTCRTPAVRPRDQDDPHDDAHLKGEKIAKRQKMFEYEAYVFGESSSGQVNESDQGPSSSGNQEQVDDYDFWTDSYASDDDEIPTKQVLQDIMEEVSLAIDEAKLKKNVDEMLRQRCTLGDEHQYHIDQMKNFLQSDIIVARRANKCIVSITKPDFKNLNKNDIEDMYLLIMNGKLRVESYQQKVNLTASTISFLGIEKHKMFSIIYDPVHGIIYKNSKKEKRVMRHLEVHKFCNVTLNRVLKGLKSYNNDVKSLPSVWSQVSLIMRTKPGVDSLSFDDLYNSLRVFESDFKGFTASSSSTQNVAFVLENTTSTNDVSTAYGVSNSSSHNSQYEHPSSYSLLANQSSCPQLDHKDLEQLDEFDLEEMDLKCCHKIGHFARECKSKGNQDSRRRDAWNTGNKDKENGRRSGKQEDSKALVTLDGEGVDWTSHSKDEQENYALMACSSSGSDTEEKIRFMKIDLDDKTDVLTYHKKLLAEAEKEKEELKAKVEKWHNSSKNLNILLNSQMSAREKAGLGYGDQMNKGVLSYENEVLQSVFISRTSDIEDSPVNDRYAEGMHAVPPPMTGIYIPSGPDKEIDDS
ncbi:hypothetical protein Tco_1058887 [Tanacetum coccineum]